MTKKVFFVGNNVDKGKLDNVMTKVSRDRDLRRLIREGRNIILKTIIIVGISVGTAIAGMLNESIVMPASIVAFLLAVQAIYSFIGDIKDTTDKTMQWFNYIKYYFSAKSPRTPLDLWRFMQGSVADIQMLNTCEHINQEKFDVVYAGLPYYEPVYIDSVVLDWKQKGNIFVRIYKIIRQYMAYRKFYKEYAEKTIIAKADAKFFKNGHNHLECSNAGFGMLFFTQYIHNEIVRRGEKHKDKIKISINIQEDDEKVREKKQKCVYQWMQYCTTPEIFEIVVGDEAEATIKVIDISMDENKLRKGNKICKFLYRIPIKRFIVYPANNISKNEYPLPDQYVQNESTIFCIGGAEQNLALQCVVNYYRWNENGKLKIGYAENVFENVSDEGFLMGTEGLVYGVRKDAIGRLVPQKEASCKAEVFCLNFEKTMPKTKFYEIYGYSAMATKMSLCKLMHSLSKLVEKEGYYECNEIERCIPGEAMGKLELIDYVVSRTPDIKVFRTKEGREFDREDLMNNQEKLSLFMEKNKEIGPIDSEAVYDVVKSKTTKIGRFEVVMQIVKKGDEEYPFSYVKIKPGICVIPFVSDTQILVQREYRHAIGTYEYQFPCGSVEENEDLGEAARRELLEETGFKVDKIEYLGSYYPSFGSTTEETYLYKAYFDEDTRREIIKNNGKSNRAKKEPLEKIETEIMTIDEVERLIENDGFKCGAGLVAWMRK